MLFFAHPVKPHSWASLLGRFCCQKCSPNFVTNLCMPFPPLQSDMYSLGVILLELFQPFGTEMERAAVLTGLRTGRIPESLSKRCPVQAKYIQLLTGKNASQRPSALQLLQSELFQTAGNVRNFSFFNITNLILLILFL